MNKLFAVIQLYFKETILKDFSVEIFVHFCQGKYSVTVQATVLHHNGTLNYSFVGKDPSLS